MTQLIPDETDAFQRLVALAQATQNLNQPIPLPPSIRERIETPIQRGLDQPLVSPIAGIPRSQTTNREAMLRLMDLAPGVGDVIAIDDAIKMLREGRPGMAAFSAATALPGIGDVGALLKMAGPSLAGLAILPRLNRAKKLGFTDDVMFHGTTGDLARFDPALFGSSTQAKSARQGVWLTNNPDEAAEYADLAAHNKLIGPIKQRMDLLEAQARMDPSKWSEWEELQALGEKLELTPEKGQTIFPLRTKGKYLEFDAKEQLWGDVKDQVDGVIDKARRQGLDGVEVKNIKDAPFTGSAGRPTTHRLVFDPKNIRSINAAFDPKKINSPELLAGIAAGAIAINALLPQDGK